MKVNGLEAAMDGGVQRTRPAPPRQLETKRARGGRPHIGEQLTSSSPAVLALRV